MSKLIDENDIIKMLNTMDRYTSEELTLCDTDKTFPKNEVFIVDDVFEGLDALPSAQPETHDKRTETNACDLISRQAAIEIATHEGAYGYISAQELSELPSAQPEPLDEWCTDCKEYDHERNCCPRWNRVIRQTLKDAQPEPKWIPCSERLPEERQEILATTTDNAWGDVVIIRTYYKEMHKSVIAWMPLPEPYREEGD